jgi:hypothetical protein
MHFTSFNKLGILLKMQFCVEAPGKSWGQAIGSLDPRGRVRGRPHAHVGLGGGRGWGGEVASVGARRWPAAVTAAARAPARGGRTGGNA